MRRLFKNTRLILPPERGEGNLAEGFLSERGGIIETIVLRRDHSDFDHLLMLEEGGSDEVIDCEGDYLAPGLIDLHCHGALGSDTMEATDEAFDRILDFHAGRGVTQIVLSTVAASLEEMVRVLEAARIYKQRGGSRLAGIHLEGPYFSPHRRGAHREQMLRHPTASETAELLKYSDVIARMTLAPELPSALELIRELTKSGIPVSAGHSEATEEESRRGFESGISQVTHLYNCMSSLHSRNGRRQTGLAEAALTTQGILCEVIADGIHLSAALLRLAWLAKGWREVAIVSDATAGAGLPEGTAFELGGIPCRISQGAARMGEGEGGCLAGSTIGMLDGVRIMVEEVGVPLEEAIAMATLVPATALGVQGQRGSLELSKRADLLRLSPDWQIDGLWVDGLKIVF